MFGGLNLALTRSFGGETDQHYMLTSGVINVLWPFTIHQIFQRYRNKKSYFYVHFLGILDTLKWIIMWHKGTFQTELLLHEVRDRLSGYFSFFISLLSSPFSFTLLLLDSFHPEASAAIDRLNLLLTRSVGDLWLHLSLTWNPLPLGLSHSILLHFYLALTLVCSVWHDNFICLFRYFLFGLLFL